MPAARSTAPASAMAPRPVATSLDPAPTPSTAPCHAARRSPWSPVRRRSGRQTSCAVARRAADVKRAPRARTEPVCPLAEDHVQIADRVGGDTAWPVQPGRKARRGSRYGQRRGIETLNPLRFPPARRAARMSRCQAQSRSRDRRCRSAASSSPRAGIQAEPAAATAGSRNREPGGDPGAWIRCSCSAARNHSATSVPRRISGSSGPVSGWAGACSAGCAAAASVAAASG